VLEKKAALQEMLLGLSPLSYASIGCYSKTEINQGD